MNLRKHIAFVISSQIALHTAVPYIKELQRRNIKINFICSIDALKEVERLSQNGDIIELISDYTMKNGLAKRLHQLSLLLITPNNYSTLYDRWLSQRFSKKNILFRTVSLYIIRNFPKTSRARLNLYLSYITNYFIIKTIKPKKVINITLTTIPFILADTNKKVYSILESWDHPSKYPMGFMSNKVFLWNDSLAEEWRYYQNDSLIYPAYPMKLAYAISKRIKHSSCIRTVMYPFSTSSESPHVALYHEEVAFVRRLCIVLERMGIDLLIKPKPNTKHGELDFFLKYPSVTLCAYQVSGGGSSYDLNDTYNKTRLRDLDKCDLVITRGTTFAFDAAANGIPVLQLTFDTPTKFPNLAKLAAYPHIAKHLLKHSHLLAHVHDQGDMDDQLYKIFNDPKLIERSNLFRDYLRNWLIPKKPKEKMIADVINEILEDD